MAIGFIPRYEAVNADGADATPENVTKGVKFLGANKVVEEGTMSFYTPVNASPAGYVDDSNETVKFVGSVGENKVIPKGDVQFEVGVYHFGNAPASLVADDQYFTSSEGVRIKGELPYYSTSYLPAKMDYVITEDVLFSANMGGAKIVKDKVNFSIPRAEFGDAEAAHVLKDKTFTSADGFNAAGTMADRGAIDVKINPVMMPSKSYTIPKGYHDGNGKVYWEYSDTKTVYPNEEEQTVSRDAGTVGLVSVIVKPIPSAYIKTSDATASAGHIVDGETAYVDGNKVTGTLKKYDGSQLEGLVAGADENNVIVVTHFEDPNYVEGNSYVYSNVPLEGFGNATAGDVLSGKTFTSADGFKVQGTISTVGVSMPNVTTMADDEESEIYIGASTTQREGYCKGGKSAAVGKYIKLKIEGDTAIMYDSEDLSKEVRRKVGANIATCTVTVEFATNSGNTLISATTFAGGAIDTTNHDFTGNTNGKEVTLTNVVCGSALSINTTTMCSLYGDGEKTTHRSLYGGTVEVPQNAGTYTVRIEAVDD